MFLAVENPARGLLATSASGTMLPVGGGCVVFGLSPEWFFRFPTRVGRKNHSGDKPKTVANRPFATLKAPCPPLDVKYRTPVET